MELLQVEHVLVLPTATFESIGRFHGFCGEVERYLAPLLDGASLSYRPRPAMEQSPEFKQLIPYVLFRHTTPSGGVLLFQYTRGKGQGEARLHSKRSVGVGGHISLVDDKFASHRAAYREGMERELREEIEILTPYSEKLVGLINDDESEVGKVHLGVVHVFDVEEPLVTPREDNMHAAGFEPVEQIVSNLDEFETWSQIALRSLFS